MRIFICRCHFMKIFILSRIHVFSLCSNIYPGWVLMDLKVLPSNFLELREYFEYFTIFKVGLVNVLFFPQTVTFYLGWLQGRLIQRLKAEMFLSKILTSLKWFTYSKYLSSISCWMLSISIFLNGNLL